MAKRRSVSSKIYRALKAGTEQGVMEWERVGKGDDNFRTTHKVAGDVVTLKREKVETPTEDDDGTRWVVTHGSIAVPLNRKQQVLARNIKEQIDGTSDYQLMKAADSLAVSFVEELDIDLLDNGSDDDDQEDESE